MIDEKKLIEEMEDEFCSDCVKCGGSCRFADIKEIINKQPKVGEWISVEERLPDEHDSMFKKFKGTPKWSNSMFEGISDEVNVTIEFEYGKTATTASHTTDGKWRCEKEYGSGTKVIAWMLLPAPYDMRKEK